MSKPPPANRKPRTKATENILNIVENVDDEDSSEDEKNQVQVKKPESTPSIPPSLPKPVIPTLVTPNNDADDDVKDGGNNEGLKKQRTYETTPPETLNAPRYPPLKPGTIEPLYRPSTTTTTTTTSKEPGSDPSDPNKNKDIYKHLMCLTSKTIEEPPPPDGTEEPIPLKLKGHGGGGSSEDSKKARKKLREKEIRAEWRRQNKGKTKRFDDIRGMCLVDSISLTERYGPKDPMKYTWKRKDNLKKFSKKCEDSFNDELQKCNFIVNLSGNIRFAPSTHASREGQRWMNIFPLYCIIPMDTDRTQFSVVNFTNRIMEVKIRITGSDNFEIAPKLSYVEPFACENVQLIFHRRRKMKKPDERLTIYFNDYYDLERMKKEFGKDKIDLTKHYAGKLAVGVFVHNYQAKPIPIKNHLPSDAKDAVARATIYAKEHQFAQRTLNQSPTEKRLKEAAALAKQPTLTTETCEDERDRVVRKNDWGKATIVKARQSATGGGSGAGPTLSNNLRRKSTNNSPNNNNNTTKTPEKKVRRRSAPPLKGHGKNTMDDASK